MIRFYRGPRASYSQTTHANGIYFATDTKEILVNNEAYGLDANQVKDVVFDETALKFTFSYNGSENKEVDLAKALGDKILTEDDRTLLASVKEMLENMSASVIYDSKLDPEIKTVTALGGIAANTKVSDLKGKEISEVLDTLIFPTVQPTKVDNSVTIVRKSTAAEIKEVGATSWTEDDFTVTANKGEIRINGAKKQDYAGAASDIVVNGVPVTMTYGTKSITGSATFAAGPTPLDSKGGTATSFVAYAGGTKTSTAVKVYVVYPFYANQAAITAFNKLPLVKSDVTNFIVKMPAESGVNTHTFKVPTSRKIKTIEMLNTLSNQYEVIALSNFVQTKETIAVNGTDVEYTVYKRNQGENGDATFRITYTNA